MPAPASAILLQHAGPRDGMVTPGPPNKECQLEVMWSVAANSKDKIS